LNIETQIKTINSEMGFLFKITNDVLIKIKQQIIETELQSICFDFES